MAEGVCTHPNCEWHGKSPVAGIGCDGNEAVRAASGPLTASGGQSGVRVTPRGPGEAYRGAEGVGAEERTGRLARVLKEVWMAGEQLNMAKPVGERIDWEMFARAIERRLPLLLLAAPVDTGDDQVERGARAMFAVTNRLDSWAEPTVPEDLKAHYRRLARAVLEAQP